MPLQATSGAASYDAFGGGVAAVPQYIEDVFSTYVYAGSNSSQTITNGIDLSTNGGLVWTKVRTTTYDHFLTDTIRGGNKQLSSNNTGASVTSSPAEISSFNTTGYTLAGGTVENVAGQNFVGWTFREQPKFFDVVTYTGNGTNGRTVAHNLGSAPGCIIIKRTSATGPWYTWHRSLTADKVIYLNTTAAQADPPYGAGSWISSDSTTVTFPNASIADVNNNGYDYVMYVFAHDAGGFGLTGTDNVISCGSFTTDGSGNATVNLGYEPQWVLIKYTTNDSWRIFDNMRGMSQTNWAELYPNTSDAEVNRTNQSNLFVRPNATGFTTTWSPQAGNTAIYIAIRRGPMKVPTSGTSVFSPNRWTSTVGSSITTNFPLDLQISKWMGAGGDGNFVQDRLRGLNTVTTNSAQPYLFTESTAAEGTNSGANYNFGNTGFLVGDNDSANGWAVNFRRAPSFFDEVCYTGTGSATTVTHNLGVVPELMIAKSRSAAIDWVVYSATTGATKILFLNQTAAAANNSNWNNTAPTSSVFSVGSAAGANGSGNTYVAYLFATCAGVSKVGSYTGTGATQTIACGFTGGARFVMIKRTDSTGSWYVWDSSRGIVSGNDPYLLLNSTAAEVTNTDYVDTYSAGFEISSTAPAAINASGGTFIFLAIA